MGIYLENGYLDFEPIYNSKFPYIFLVGGRAIGKTYGSLDYAREHEIKIMYMRRTQAQADIASNPVFSPYKSINRDKGCNVQMHSISKYNSLIAETDADGNVIKELGYTCALSTISNTRGFDASDVAAVVYDEFIPEPHERPIKEEASALFNALETIGRNRELQGKPPLKLIALSNSNDIACALFQELKLVSRVLKMQRDGVTIWTDNRRGIMIILPHESKIAQGKRTTSLYNMTRGSRFQGMALDNAFGNASFSNIASRPLIEYKALVKVGKVVIMRHKSNAHYYVTQHEVKCAHYYDDSRVELARFRAVYPWVYTAYLNRSIIFEDEQCELLLREYIRA